MIATLEYVQYNNIMMKSTQTPFGHFQSQIAAARHIHGAGYKPAFDAAFPAAEWPRHDWGDRYAAQNLPKDVQDICDVIRQLVKANVPGWRDA